MQDSGNPDPAWSIYTKNLDTCLLLQLLPWEGKPKANIPPYEKQPKDGKKLKKKERKENKGWKRLAWHAPSVSSRICSAKSVKSSQESLQTAKRKEKKDKMSWKPRKESAVQHKVSKRVTEREIPRPPSTSAEVNSEEGRAIHPKGHYDTEHRSQSYETCFKAEINNFKVPNKRQQRFISHKKVMQMFPPLKTQRWLSAF